MSAIQGREMTPSMVFATPTNSRMEMGNHLHGLHHMITKINQTKRHHHGSCGQTEKGFSLHTHQVNLKGNRYFQHFHERYI
jgi:hypothetical protein